NAFYFKQETAAAGILPHHPADAGNLFETLLHIGGIRPAIRRFDLYGNRFRTSQAVGEVHYRIDRNQLALADDNDALAGVLDLREDMGAQNDRVIARQRAD